MHLPLYGSTAFTLKKIHHLGDWYLLEGAVDDEHTLLYTKKGMDSMIPKELEIFSEPLKTNTTYLLKIRRIDDNIGLDGTAYAIQHPITMNLDEEIYLNPDDYDAMFVAEALNIMGLKVIDPTAFTEYKRREAFRKKAFLSGSYISNDSLNLIEIDEEKFRYFERVPNEQRPFLQQFNYIKAGLLCSLTNGINQIILTSPDPFEGSLNYVETHTDQSNNIVSFDFGAFQNLESDSTFIDVNIRMESKEGNKRITLNRYKTYYEVVFPNDGLIDTIEILFNVFDENKNEVFTMPDSVVMKNIKRIQQSGIDNIGNIPPLLIDYYIPILPIHQ